MSKNLFLVAVMSSLALVSFAEDKVETTTRQVQATTPSEEIKKETEIIRVYMDTTYTYSTTTTRREKVEPADTTWTRKGHYLQALFGAGYGSLGYGLKDLQKGLTDARNNGGFNWLLQFNYVYYFHENVGFMVGLQAEQMNSTAVLNGTKTWTSNGDSDNGEEYSHTVTMKDWKESQTSFMLGLPIGFQFQFPIAKMPKVTHRNNQLRLYFDLGAKVNYLVAQKYNLKSGSIEHSGSYDKWNLALDESMGADRDYYTETIGESKGWVTDKKNLSLKNLSVDGMADLGFMIPLKEHLDLMIGLYANYTFNNLRDKEKEIGWRNDAEEGYRQHAFMESYEGVLATDYVKSVRPWDVGVKIGISWNATGRKPKKSYETLVTRDTTYALARREVGENIQLPVAARKINEIMKKSVIWFDFDSDKPKLQPADVVDRIAQVLLDHPEQLVLVYGHASKEGTMEYNQNLSERRARAIVRLLKLKGVPSDQIVSKGFSYTQQYDDSENPYHDIALDRRVEIIPVFEKDRISE